MRYGTCCGERLIRNQTAVIRTGNKLQVVRGSQLPCRAGVGEGHWEGASVISVWIVSRASKWRSESLAWQGSGRDPGSHLRKVG